MKDRSSDYYPSQSVGKLGEYGVGIDACCKGHVTGPDRFIAALSYKYYFGPGMYIRDFAHIQHEEIHAYGPYHGTYLAIYKGIPAV